MWRWSAGAAIVLLMLMNCGETVGTGTVGGGTGGTGGRDRAGAGAGSRERCPAGTETCSCYGNGTCNEGLVCASSLCVDLSEVATGGRNPATNAVPTNTAPTNVAVTNAVVVNLPTNVAVTNAVVVNLPTTVAVTNAAPTTVAVTNAAPTNVAVTNAVPTNVAVTNAATTNSSPTASNYIDDGTIRGYCFGFQQVDGNVTTCDLAEGLSCPYELPGTSWDDIALLGCNVNQSEDDELAGTLVPTFSSVCIEGTGFERIQMEGPSGATSVNDRWCAAAPAGGGCVPLSEFNTTCWDNSGAYYANQPLKTISATQPSKSDGVDVSVTSISGTIVITAVYVQ